MDVRDTRKYYKKYSMPRGALYGAIGGLVAGWVMAPFLMITMIMVGMSDDTFFVVIGKYLTGAQTDEEAVQSAFGLHLMTSAIIGSIFGTVTASTQKLRISSFTKGVGEGLATGMIAFVVLFLPLTMAAFPNWTEVISERNPDMTEEQVVNLAEVAFPAVIILSVADHLIYGMVLGVATSGFIVGVRKVRRKSIEK